MGAFKLGKMTFGSLFKKPETVKYPFEQKPKPMGLKGHIHVDADACILCGMCDRNCATGCISVDKAARTWSIDAFGCIQCGYCVTICPKNCLHMEPDYHPASVEMSRDVVVIPEQHKPAKEASKPAASAAKPDAKAEVAPASNPAATDRDEQLEALISLMDAGAAEKVREALTRCPTA